MRTTAALLSLLLVSRASLARAADAGDPGPSKEGPLLVLLVAADPTARVREQRFIVELTLALDGVAVIGVDPGMPEFARKPLADQIVTVRELLARHQGVASTWLNTVSPELILLHMVVLSSGQALVRLVEGNPRQAGFETDLAMAARTLLGTAFLFHRPPAEDRALAAVVSDVRRAAAPPLEPEWSLGVQATVDGGLVGQQGPTVSVGGTLSIERQLSRHLAARAVLDVLAGPLGDADSHEISGLTVAPGLGAAYLWDAGPLRIGPIVDVRVGWSNLWVEVGAATQGVAFWSGRLDLGAQARWNVTKSVAVTGGAGCGVSPWTRDLTLRSTGEILLATGWLNWQASIGLLVRL